MKNPPKQTCSFEFKNIKQTEFFDLVMYAIAGLNNYRRFYYGGAIRGGKTYVCLFILVTLARLYPKSRWHIIREDFPALEATAIPSMEKLIGAGDGLDFKWKRKSGNFHILFSNGSKIFFKPESFTKDQNLGWLLGLETNGILIEQGEGVQQKLLTRVTERLGSWYIDPMPPPLLFITFNPTKEWPKAEIYERFIQGEFKDNEIFIEALPNDNPFVTAEQWKNWENLDEDSYNQMIKASWAFPSDGKVFAYKFDRKKHVVDVRTPEGAEFMKIIKTLPLHLIFDFNVDPITCLVAQRSGISWGKIIHEYRLRNSDIFELIERIKEDFGEYFLVATGDASGRNRTAITKGNRSYVRIIQDELKLSDRQMQFPKSNPTIADTRVLTNSIFNKHKSFWISSNCLWLINDLETVRTDEKGGIEKDKDKLKTHLLDNLRYFHWNYFKTFLNFKS
jgi:hypothetical protein